MEKPYYSFKVLFYIHDSGVESNLINWVRVDPPCQIISVHCLSRRSIFVEGPSPTLPRGGKVDVVGWRQKERDGVRYFEFTEILVVAPDRYLSINMTYYECSPYSF